MYMYTAHIGAQSAGGKSTTSGRLALLNRWEFIWA
eukprot:COSAG05_NODE_22682_length_263_cov_0.628049_1_plen_34_part_01